MPLFFKGAGADQFRALQFGQMPPPRYPFLSCSPKNVLHIVCAIYTGISASTTPPEQQHLLRVCGKGGTFEAMMFEILRFLFC